MAHSQSTGLSDNEQLIIVAGFCIAFFTGLYLRHKDYIESSQMWWDLAKIVLTVTGIVILIFIIIPRVWRFRENRKYERYNLSINIRDANRLLQEACEKKVRRENLIEELQCIAKSLRATPKFLATQIQQVLPKVENEARRLQEAIEREKHAAEEKEKRKQAEFSRQANQVYQAFIEQGHTRTIPESFKNFDRYAIHIAEKWFENYERERRSVVREKHDEERHRKEAIRFIWKHRALPSDYPQWSNERKAPYEEAMALLNSGQLKNVIDELREEEHEQHRKDYLTDQDYVQLAGSIEAGKQREKELLQRDFYFASELKDVEQNFLLKFHGFKKSKISDFGERLLPVLYRCSERNESPNHFCTKHLFARLHPGAKIEATDWWDNEVDVLFSKGKQKLAVEIERGTNKPEYIKEKIASLVSAKYAKIILVVPRDVLPKYRQYHDGKLVFVSTAKQAREAILKWLQ